MTKKGRYVNVTPLLGWLRGLDFRFGPSDLTGTKTFLNVCCSFGWNL